MLSFWISLGEAALLAAAVSTDAFAAGLAYGAKRIRIPVLSAVIISMIGSLMLGLSLLAGSVIRPWLPADFAPGMGFAILLFLGIAKLFDSSIKAYIRKHKSLKKNIRFSLSSLRFILTVYADPQEADQDASQSLSALEAASLAVALSLDSLAAGIGAGVSQVGPLEAVLVTFVMGLLAVAAGHAAGSRVAERCPADLSWIGGVLLILLAVLRL